MGRYSGRTGVVRLRPGDATETLDFLTNDAERNLYLLGLIRRGALSDDDVGGPILGAIVDGRLECVCAMGSNLNLSHPATPQAVELLADYARRMGIPFWVAVGDDALIARFMELYGRRTRPILLERTGQRHYALRAAPLDSHGGSDVRRAEIEDMEEIVRLDRAMVLEELGFDPFGPVLHAYRQGWLRRIREGRAWVAGPVGGPLFFKADESANCTYGVQVAGIYTVPDRRKEGVATSCLADLAARVLVDVPVMSLYVASDNLAAIRVYERLGFEHRGEVRCVWFRL